MLFRHHISNKKKYFFPIFGEGGVPEPDRENSQLFFFFLNPSLIEYELNWNAFQVEKLKNLFPRNHERNLVASEPSLLVDGEG